MIDLDKVILHRFEKRTAYSATDKEFFDWFAKGLRTCLTASNRLEIRRRLVKLLQDYGVVKEGQAKWRN